jgi:mRNA-degrading endonuclease RelE of RelBE toxin-antitoxin system
VREVVIKPVVQKYIKRLQKQDRRRIGKAIQGLAEVPPYGDIRRLRGKKDESRLRTGDYRVLFYIKGDTILVHKIDTRGQVYK